MKKKGILLVLILALLISTSGCKKKKPKVEENPDPAEVVVVQNTGEEEQQNSSDPVVDEVQSETLPEDGQYDSKEEVAFYLSIYGKLPSNYITKAEARDLGWSSGGLDAYAYGKCIGGDYFGNYEGNLPEKKGREYHECDIDTMHAKSRGSKRLVYSNDGLIYYTEDHYETFELLYGEEE